MAKIINLNEYENTNEAVLIGRQLEDDTRVVTYDLSDLIEIFGEGTFEFVYERPDKVIYLPAKQIRVDDNACWILTAADTSVKGGGKVEVRFYPNDTSGSVNDLYKTKIFNTMIAESLGAVGPVPDPYADIIETMRGLKNDTEEYKDAAEDAKDAAVSAKDDAQAASEAIQDMSVEGISIASGQAPTVEKIIDPQTGAVTLKFGIPMGHAGEGAVVYNAEMTLTEAEKSRARKNIGADFFEISQGRFYWLIEEEEE